MESPGGIILQANLLLPRGCHTGPPAGHGVKLRVNIVPATCARTDARASFAPGMIIIFQ